MSMASTNMSINECILFGYTGTSKRYCTVAALVACIQVCDYYRIIVMVDNSMEFALGFNRSTNQWNPA